MEQLKSRKHAIVFALVLTLSICLYPCLVRTKPSTKFLKLITIWHVYVVNGLSNNKTLFIHCKSKDDDLGVHHLFPGADFTWSFRENFLQNTLFWCYMRKDDAHSAFKVFWHDVLLFYKCMWKNCIWIAKDDGIYIKDIRKNCDEFRHEWEPGW